MNGFYEIEINVDVISMLLSEDYFVQEKFKEVCEDDDDVEMIYLVVVNIYFVMVWMLQLIIVVVDIILIELKCLYMVWSWFVYVLVVNLLLVIFLLWIVVWWSLCFIEVLVWEVCEFEDYYCEMFNLEMMCELISFVCNFN